MRRHCCVNKTHHAKFYIKFGPTLSLYELSGSPLSSEFQVNNLIEGLIIASLIKVNNNFQLFSVPSSDLDSTAGSEWEADDFGGSSSSHLSAISKEQLFQMLQKSRFDHNLIFALG